MSDITDSPPPSSNWDALLKAYLDVCNQALRANHDKFPFNHIIKSAIKDQMTKPARVAIIDDAPQSIYQIALKEDRVACEKLAPPKKTNCAQPCSCDAEAPAWIVSRRYMEDVINNPETYIQNPAKIDWDWLIHNEDGC